MRVPLRCSPRHLAAVLQRMLWLLAFLASAGAATACGSPRPDRPRETLHYEQRAVLLSTSGVSVLVAPDDTSRLVSVGLRFRVGSAHDPPGKHGLAHFAEHLLFALRPGGPDKPELGTELAGVSLGYNAFTSYDSTHFTTYAYKAALPDLLRIEAAWLSFRCEQLPEAAVERERDAVRNELREHANASALDLVMATVYPADHPYHHPIGGTEAEVSTITRADVCAFIETYYTPERAILVIAGDVTSDDVVTLAQERFAHLPSRPSGPDPEFPPLVWKRGPFAAEANVEHPTVVLAFPFPQEFAEERAAADVWVGLWESELGEQFGKGTIFSASVDVAGGAKAPVLLARATVKSASQLDEATQQLGDSLRAAEKKMRKLGPARQARFVGVQYRLNLAALFENIEPLAGRDLLLADYLQFDEKTNLVLSEAKRVGHLPLLRSYDHVFARQPATEIRLRPRASSASWPRAVWAESNRTHPTTDRRAPVDPAEAFRDVPLPKVRVGARAHESFLPNGTRVLWAARPTLPLFHLQLILPGGHAADPPGQEGLAWLAALLVEPLTGSLFAYADDDAIDYAFYQVGGGVTCSVIEDFTEFSVAGLSSRYDALIAGLGRYVLDPTFDGDDLTKYRRRKTPGLITREAVYEDKVARALGAALWGADHPYAHSLLFTPASLARIDRDALQDFADRHYQSGDATLVVTGRFDPKLLLEHLAYVFQRLREPTHAPAHVHIPPAMGKSAQLAGNSTEAQTSLEIYFPTPPGVDDRQAARLLLAVLLQQRFDAVRERLGASYGVQIMHESREGPGLLSIHGQLVPARAGAALSAILDAVANFDKEEDFLPNFVHARRALLQQLLLRGSDVLEEELAFVARHRLPVTYLDELAKKVASLRPDDVRRVAREVAAQNRVILLRGEEDDVTAAYAQAGISNVQWIR